SSPACSSAPTPRLAPPACDRSKRCALSEPPPPRQEPVMPDQQPVLPDQEPVTSGEAPATPGQEPLIEDGAAHDTAVRARQPGAYEPIDEQEEWFEEPVELPRRPRRRLLSTLPLALLGVLLAVCGFIVGVLVEKGQGSSSSSAAGSASSLASRFEALRAGASGTSGAAGGLFGAGAGATAGTVAYISGDTLYVTSAEGNTVKVTTSPGTTVTKTVKAEVKGFLNGAAATVTGASGSN